MLQSSLYIFKSSSSEDLLTSTTTEKLSDAITLEAAGLNDGANKFFFNVSVKDAGNAAAGASFAVALKDCDTSGGTYAVVLSKAVPLASVTTGATVYKVQLPAGLRKYVKASITGASGMTGGATFNASIVTG